MCVGATTLAYVFLAATQTSEAAMLGSCEILGWAQYKYNSVVVYVRPEKHKASKVNKCYKDPDGGRGPAAYVWLAINLRI